MEREMLLSADGSTQQKWWKHGRWPNMFWPVGISKLFVAPQVSVVWPDKHTSVFDSEWLKKHCFSDAARQALREELFLNGESSFLYFTCIWSRDTESLFVYTHTVWFCCQQIVIHMVLWFTDLKNVVIFSQTYLPCVKQAKYWIKINNAYCTGLKLINTLSDASAVAVMIKEMIFKGGYSLYYSCEGIIVINKTLAWTAAFSTQKNSNLSVCYLFTLE